ncbi:MAG: PHB depolymerase family esterase [Ilumatobacteraceae bacterium]
MRTRRSLLLPLVAVLGVACASAATGGPATAAPDTTVPDTTVPAATTAAPAGTDSTAHATAIAPTVGSVAPAVPAIGTVVERTIVTPDGRSRRYRVYVPSRVPDGPLPLLLAFHGGTGWGAQFEKNSGFDELAEANGFLVAYPDGVGAGVDESANRTWNGGDCCGAAARKQVDDVAFVSTLLDTLEGDYSIDLSRVFAAGHSNGGILAYRLACELSERIVAVGLQSGSMEIADCSPSAPVSLLHIHGTDDSNLPIDGGRGADTIADVDFHSPRDSVQAFATADGCRPEPVVAVDANNPDLTVSAWPGCGEGAEVRFVAVTGAAHSWMGHTPSNPTAAPAYQGLDSSFEIVSFLLAHPRTTP